MAEKIVQDLTSERLRELLDYDPETGVFRWRVSPKYSKVKVGDAAGGLSCEGYLRIRVDKNLYKAHRLVWLHVRGVWPSAEIDHTNRVRHDNRLANLREVSHTENMRNQSKRCDNASEHVGVRWYRPTQKWQASIRHLGKLIHLGYFTDINDALAARKAAEVKYWGAERVE